MAFSRFDEDSHIIGGVKAFLKYLKIKRELSRKKREHSQIERESFVLRGARQIDLSVSSR